LSFKIKDLPQPCRYTNYGYKRNEVIMDFNFEDTTLFEHKDNALNDMNSYMIVSKNENVNDMEMNNIIKIIDETGAEVNCTYDKFVEIFDEEGLAGFIM